MVRMGIDGCRGGWLIAKTEGERGDLSAVSLSVVPTLAQALKGKALKEKALKEKALEKRGFKEKALNKKGLKREALNKEAVRKKATQLVLIDMPKGLLSDKARKIEGLARQLLKGQASTVFNVPVVDAVFAGDYQDASAINYRMTGKKLSKQAWYLCPKIRELDELLAEESSLSDEIFESHPELVFRLMAGVQLPKKKLAEGLTARLALLERAGMPATQLVNHLIDQYPRSVCFADDAVDALVLLLLAHSPSEDLDQEAEIDRRGIPINLKIPLRPAVE